jgi:hypothetical protein
MFQIFMNSLQHGHIRFRILHEATKEQTANGSKRKNAKPPQPVAKKPKLVETEEAPPATPDPKPSSSGEGVPKPPTKPSTIKGLSTQKPQIEKHIRQAASTVLASINPGVQLSLEEKRQKLAEIKTVGMTTTVMAATPEQEKFLLHVFKDTLKEWPAGYEDILLLTNPPPTIEKPSAEDPSKMERKFGPVPKIDPDFLVPALAGYSAAKLHSNQNMTTWDHHFRSWMQVKKKKPNEKAKRRNVCKFKLTVTIQLLYRYSISWRSASVCLRASAWRSPGWTISRRKKSNETSPTVPRSKF